ncbi:MAG: helix-turn-helix domain-containing protein [Alphaproteobacteria bacterium]|nr:MAG: helix-turn-helix domain-containing protein [Alphaproteobacteria bacterium]
MIGRWKTPKDQAPEEPLLGFDSYEVRLGDLMRGERATLGKSLLDVERELRIKATYIAAIENADLKVFSTPSFVPGYVRSYARYLGMDPDETYAAFCRESGFEPPNGLGGVAPAAKPAERPEKAGPLGTTSAAFVPPETSIFDRIDPAAVGSLAMVLGLIGVLGFGGWKVLTEIQKVRFAPVEQTVGVMEEIPGLGGAPEAAPSALVLADETASGDGADISAPVGDALERIYRPAALDVPVLIARDGPISTLDPSEVGVLAGLGAEAEAPSALITPASGAGDGAIDEAVDLALNQTPEAAAPAAPGGVRVFGPDAPEVAIFAVRPSWVRVRAADGSVLFEKILDAGEKYVLPPLENPARLRTGNAGSVYFAVNGTAYGPAGSGASVVKNIPLSPEALTGKYQVADLNADKALADFVALAQAEQ